MIAVVAVVAVVALAAGRASATTTPSERCAAAKRVAAGRNFAGLLTCDAKAATKGAGVDGGCLSRAAANFASRWIKAESKAGCTTQQDANTIAQLINGHRIDLETALQLTGPTASKCTGGKFKAAGLKAACSISCSARAALHSLSLTTPIVAGCLSACQRDFEAAFAKAETRSACRTTGDGNDVASAVDALVSEVTDALPTGSGTGGQGSTTTTTTIAGGPTTSTTLPRLGACTAANTKCGSCGDGACKPTHATGRLVCVHQACQGYCQATIDCAQGMYCVGTTNPGRCCARCS